MQTDIIVIGTGPVGLFSIFQAGMLGMKTESIDALEVIGGQCAVLYPEKPIYDIPGYPKILAQELIDQLLKQAMPFNPKFHLNQVVTAIEPINNTFKVTTSKGTQITAKGVIIAGGCGSFAPNRPPLAGIDEYEGKSVFYAVSKINDFVGQNIVIAGGGDSAVDWALSLSKVANKIYVVHRRDKFRAAPESIRQMHEIATTGKIELITGYQLSQLVGEQGKLNKVIVKDLDGQEKSLGADKLLPFFGLAQELGPMLSWGLNIKAHHICVEPTYFETNTPGIYAVGDIASYPGKLKLILTGFAEVASVMHHVYSRVFDGKALHFEHSTSKSNLVNG
jgi:thioredoxin reductase (NADPH)